jgi:glutaminyl-tRNA synthetase
MNESDKKPVSNFIRNIIREDLKNNKNDGRVHTRFPPEPNGYLHIGHAKSICLNFGIAAEHDGGLCNLRFDDTNPEKEDVEYTEAIMEDIRWLGFDWGDRLYYASDYFEQLFEYAIKLINDNKAYVDSLSAGEIREYRGTLTEHGRESPDRNRSVEACRQVPGWRACPARQDRYDVTEHQHARSDHLPDQESAPSPDREQVVHLPHV